PMILGPDRSKLSKRHGATALLDYRAQGFLPEAMANFLALLGWSLDDKTEVLSQEELVRHFSIERISKAAAIFNIEKLTWMNGVYIRKMGPEALAAQLATALTHHAQEKGITLAAPITQDALRPITPLVQERLHTLQPQEVWDLCGFFLTPLPAYGDTPFRKSPLAPQAQRAALEKTVATLESLEDFSATALEGALRPLAERLGLKTRDLFMLIRVAVTGTDVAPPLFETMAVLGKGRTLDRLRHVMNQA
ncbi:MAG: glutamate--tRNA ligase, partial [Chloroflexi bacterium]|nr:glutamate--tRNA ligase [Chloroflexota bacterium]